MKLKQKINNKSLVVITGPTASGKTDLAIEIAKICGGEIICADSKTIYLDMNVGTAKPTKEELKEVPHWGIDLVRPGEYFSVADFKKYADDKIKEIRSREHVPILVGGTGLYIDAVLFDYSFAPPVNEEMRFDLQQMEVAELQDYCLKNNIELPENSKNKRYLIRAIEKKGIKVDKREKPIDDSIIVGIATDKNELKKRIKYRIEKMIESGVVSEAEKIAAKYNTKSEALKANIYPLIFKYLSKEISLDELKQKCEVADWHLVKKQITWMKRNKFIKWLNLKDAKKYILDNLDISE